MQTRQTPRKSTAIPGRYFTGTGTPVDVTLKDLSEGGCRFAAASGKLIVGAPIQIYIGRSGPHSVRVRWVEDGEVGVTFIAPLDIAQVEKLESGDTPDAPGEAPARDFAPAAATMPRRFC